MSFSQLNIQKPDFLKEKFGGQRYILIALASIGFLGVVLQFHIFRHIIVWIGVFPSCNNRFILSLCNWGNYIGQDPLLYEQSFARETKRWRELGRHGEKKKALRMLAIFNHFTDIDSLFLFYYRRYISLFWPITHNDFGFIRSRV